LQFDRKHSASRSIVEIAREIMQITGLTAREVTEEPVNG
jgi:hypothetical protein